MIIKTFRWIMLSSAIVSSVMLNAHPSLAGVQYVSKDGNLTLTYGDRCSTTKPTGSYHVVNGVSGELTALSCDNFGGDISEQKFTDTDGQERCYGRMTQIWSVKVMTIWKIDGTVPGHSCSQVGKTFEIEMDSGKRI